MHSKTQDFPLLLVDDAEAYGESSGSIPYPPSPLGWTSRLTELAIHEVGETERYVIERLANEILRQSEIIAEKGGGLSPAEKTRLVGLMLSCAAELRTVSAHLETQLLEILLE